MPTPWSPIQWGLCAWHFGGGIQMLAVVLEIADFSFDEWVLWMGVQQGFGGFEHRGAGGVTKLMQQGFDPSLGGRSVIGV